MKEPRHKQSLIKGAQFGHDQRDQQNQPCLFLPVEETQFSDQSHYLLLSAWMGEYMVSAWQSVPLVTLRHEAELGKGVGGWRFSQESE